jgi:AcrR family transcriptional regulator
MKLKEKLTSRDLQAIERREQILKASKELFAANGYHATTTRLICKKINMADGLIYHYFPDGKLEILRKVIEEFGYSNLKSADEKSQQYLTILLYKK